MSDPSVLHDLALASAATGAVVSACIDRELLINAFRLGLDRATAHDHRVAATCLVAVCITILVTVGGAATVTRPASWALTVVGLLVAALLGMAVRELAAVRHAPTESKDPSSEIGLRDALGMLLRLPTSWPLLGYLAYLACRACVALTGR